MPYYDGTCDECGAAADMETPMYCLCWECYDGDFEYGDDSEDDQ